MSRLITGIFGVILLGQAIQAAVVEHTFDKEPAGAGTPVGLNVYGNSLGDRGVTRQTSVSGDQCAFVTADFGQEYWGVILLSDMGSWGMEGRKISVAVKSSAGFEGKLPCVGFKLIDEDGTGYRTRDVDLFTPTTSWQTFEQDLGELQQDEELGEQPGLDLRNIKQYGVIFFDRQDHNRVVTFYADDLKVE